ncbi:MAG: hypothetical protein WD749_11850 [Phycisphaerales bacterium]
MRTRVIVVFAAVASAAATASAQWSDNFDTYSIGTINGQGGWKGWDNTPAAAGLVTNNVFNSAPNSQQINGGADSVREYAGYTSGQWSYGGDVFIPSGLTTGHTYFILLNKYLDNGTAADYRWSSQLTFNLATGLAYDSLAGGNVNPSPGSLSIPVVRDAWIPFRVDFDLTADTQSIYYNNTLVMATSWKRGNATGANALAAVDLFANNSGAIFYDNLALIPAPGVSALLALGGLLAARRRR